MTPSPPSPGNDAPDVSALLYRAAIGPRAQARYLERFQAFDAQGGPRPTWNAAACASALNWLAWRGLWRETLCWGGTAVLGTVAVLGTAKLVFGAAPTQLWMLLTLLAIAASVAWGLGADALYHRVCSRRILQAVAARDSIPAACAYLARRNATRQRWVGLIVVNTAAALTLSASLAVLPPRMKSAPPAVALPELPARPAASSAITAIDERTTVPPQPEPTPAETSSADAVLSADTTTATSVEAALPPARARSATTRLYAVQIGVFAEVGNATRARAQLEMIGLPVDIGTANDKGHQRVRAGPFANQTQAQHAAERIKALGLPAVVLKLPPKAKGPVE